MDSWPRQFQQRLDDFGRHRGPGRPVSIKVRINSGCFHREHSPRAYKILDEYVSAHGLNGCAIEEHETGPELLLWLAAGTAGLTFAKSVIDLIATIIKARSEGIKKGDQPSAGVLPEFCSE